MKKIVVFTLLLITGVFALYNPYFLKGERKNFTPHVYKNPDVIGFTNGLTINSKAEPAIPEDLRKDDSYLKIVHFSGPIYEYQRIAVEESGGHIIAYLPNYAYLVEFKDVPTTLKNLPGVDKVLPFQPAYKIKGELLKSVENGFNGFIEVSVEFTEPMYVSEIEDLFKFAENVLYFPYKNGKVWIVRMSVNVDDVKALANDDRVVLIEKWYPRYLMNEKAQWVMQTWENGNRALWDKGLDGTGQIIAHLDSGINTNHKAFDDPDVSISDFGVYPTHRKIVAYRIVRANDGSGNIIESHFGDEPQFGYHGSHTGGTLAGDDSYNSGTNPNDGIAINAKIDFQDLSAQYNGNWILLLGSDLGWHFNWGYSNGARICSNSWGSQSASGPMDYDAQCQSMDQFIWDHPDYLPFFAAGNTDRGIYMGSPAVAKNCVSVGGTKDGTAAYLYNSVAVHSYTKDGRIAPTVVAPATLTSVYGQNNSGYIQYSGTSMATPAAAATATIIRQYYVEGWYGTGKKGNYPFNPSAALIKATLIGSTEMDIENHPSPDPYSGWGRPNLDNGLYVDGDSRGLRVVDEQAGLKTSEELDYTVNVPASIASEHTDDIKIVLVWSDKPSFPNSSKNLINDLDLEVEAPDGTKYGANDFEDNFSKPNPAGTDELNNVEVVRVENPQAGKWIVRVKGTHVPLGPQPFALVIVGKIDMGDIVYKEHSVSGGNNNGLLDPGETADLNIVLKNVGAENMTGIKATVSSSNDKITFGNGGEIDFGDIEAGKEVTKSISVTADGSVNDGTEAPMIIHIEDGSGNYSKEVKDFLIVGIKKYDYVDLDEGDVLLTVTKQGGIGFMAEGKTGNGFQYPKGSQTLYHASLMVGYDADHVYDRMYPDATTETGNADWEATTDPDGRVTVKPGISDMDAKSIYEDSGHPEPAGLTVTQLAYSWKDEKFIIMRFLVKNNGESDLSNVYAGIMADFDIGDAQINVGGKDASRNLEWMAVEGADLPHVGISILQPTDKIANLALLKNNGYVYNQQGSVWHDETAWKFLNGELGVDNSTEATDWSIFISAGPYSIAQGSTETLSVAIAGGDNLDDLKEAIDAAKNKFDHTDFGIEETSFSGLTFELDKVIGKKAIIKYALDNRMVEINVYNIVGEKVKTLYSGIAKGVNTVKWSGLDEKGKGVGNGVYFIRLKSDNLTISKKFVLVK